MVRSPNIGGHANLKRCLVASGESVTSFKLVTLVVSALVLSACNSTNNAQAPEPDAGILWAAHAAEYQAISAQVYAQATRDLPRLLADKSWSAVPGHGGETGKPPAIILDVDETVLSGVDMELTLVPFSTQRQYEWGLSHTAIPIRGGAEFILAAKNMGIEVFFVTNRPCMKYEGAEGGCPIEQGTIDDLREVGIETDADHLFFANEMDGWDREKVVRREYIAATHRVLMLIGDDYADFVACARGEPKLPCTTPATRESRAEALDTYKDFWGNGWYILPNPMYGSWTSVD